MDCVERLMERFDVPRTRENYLRWAYLGDPPKEPLDAELECMLPDDLQLNPPEIFE